MPRTPEDEWDAIGVASPHNRDAKVEQLKQQDDVKRALKQTSGAPAPAAIEPRSPRSAFVWLFVLLFLVFSALYFVLRVHSFGLPPTLHAFLIRFDLGAAGIVFVLAVFRVVDAYVIEHLHDAVAEYNLRRALKLIAAFLMILIVISIVFVNWYAAVVSFGVFSIIFGLALQTTFTSFIGWIYILIRAPYRVGDRIKINGATGDVIDVGYLDTTLWEFGGDFLSTDHPSGRVIRFPNSKVLDTEVFNYSWPVFPYIWNEIKFSIAYESDLDFVARTMQAVAEEELGETMMERVRTFTELLAETPIDKLEVREKPTVIFRVNANTWLDAIVRYVVPPRQAGRIKTRLIKKMLERLKAEPDLTLFPKSNAR